MNNLEKCVSNQWEKIKIQTKGSTEPELPEDEGTPDQKEVFKTIKKKAYQREMKKGMAHMTNDTKDYTKYLSTNADAPYAAHIVFKQNHSVYRVCQDFPNLDKEQNKFKVTDASVDPNKVFATLDEHSKKFKEFGDMHEQRHSENFKIDGSGYARQLSVHISTTQHTY